MYMLLGNSGPPGAYLGTYSNPNPGTGANVLAAGRANFGIPIGAAANQVPVLDDFDNETVYFVRVTGMSAGLALEGSTSRFFGVILFGVINYTAAPIDDTNTNWVAEVLCLISPNLRPT